MASARVCLALVLLASSAFADIYLHNPRGSNNRLNEQSANRNNGDRLFDSQNNNRGGYNVGDKTAAAFNGGTAPYGSYPPETVYNINDNTAMHYPLMYYEGSVLSLEWTAQHGCGGNDANDPHMLNCNLVLQYTCETDSTETDPAMQVILRDGGNTNTPDEPNSLTDVPGNNAARGHHESEASYYECKTRNRNRGLFHADQNLNGNSARYTRQNNNGNRRGLECTEERDYYPYWGPTIWRDIAYLTSDPTMCDWIKAESQNQKEKCKCTGTTAATTTNDHLKPITQEGCADAGGVWKCFKHNIPVPDCDQAPWTRVNHLGNGRHGQPVTYNWTLPTFADHFNGKKIRTHGLNNEYAKCVFRIRYNISTDDYNGWNISSEFDENRNQGIVSPITNNPTVDVGADLQGLRLAINTAQFGRTFQDRSHVFFIRKRPTAWASKKIFNLNVRGKRGNIVQTYPSVEYDFAPNRLHIKADDLLHIQWTGSNTHNNGNPAGDGQAGDAGEGTGGTDRHNFVQMLNAHDNFPLPLDKFAEDNIFAKSMCYNTDGSVLSANWVDCALLLATSGYHRSVTSVDGTFDPLLNNAPASLPGGGVVMAVQPGTYHYACTRNNNFSNRSQKGVLIVEA